MGYTYDPETGTATNDQTGAAVEIPGVGPRRGQPYAHPGMIGNPMVQQGPNGQVAPAGPPPVVMANPVFRGLPGAYPGGQQQPYPGGQPGGQPSPYGTPGQMPGQWLAMAHQAPQYVGGWRENANTAMPAPAPRPVIGAPNLNTLLAQQQQQVAPPPAVVAPPRPGPGYIDRHEMVDEIGMGGNSDAGPGVPII